MTDPVQDLAWLCGRCRKPYTAEDMAKQCCTCISCGGTTEHLGRLSRCRKCGLKETMEHNLKYQRDLAATLEQTRIEAKARGWYVITSPDGTVTLEDIPKPVCEGDGVLLGAPTRRCSGCDNCRKKKTKRKPQ